MFSHSYQSSCSSSFDGTQIYSFCVLDYCNRSPGSPPPGSTSPSCPSSSSSPSPRSRRLWRTSRGTRRTGR